MNDAMNEYLILYYYTEDACTRILCYARVHTARPLHRRHTAPLACRHATCPHACVRTRAGNPTACSARRRPDRKAARERRPARCTFARQGRSVHGSMPVARSTRASLDPRSHRSAHAHTHARPTLTRMLAPRAHARGTHARPTPLHSAHPCARPTRTRASKAVVRPAVVVPAAAAPVSAAVGAVVAVSLAPAVAATVAMVAAIDISACSARHRRARQLWPLTGGPTRSRRGADIAQASGRGRGFTCKSPRLGRVGHAGRGKRTLPARALSSKMIWASPCLRKGMPAVVRRAQCQGRGDTKPRAAGGARQGRAARSSRACRTSGLGCFRACSHLAGVQTNLVCSRGETVVRTLLTPRCSN